MLRLAHLTALVSSIFTVLLLKGLHSFKFIKWHPTKFLQMIEEPFFRYIVLGIIIYVIAWLLFLIGMFLRFSAISAFIMAVIIVFIVECVLMDQPINFSNTSISFFVLTIINCRFIMETAAFHKKLWA